MKTIGIVTNNQNHIFQRHVIAGAQEVAEKQEYNVFVDSIAEDPGNPRSLSLDITALAGVLVIADVLPGETLLWLHQMGKPISLVSHYVPELPIPAVISNNAQGMRQLACHLLTTCQRRSFVFIRGRLHQRDNIEREEAFIQELMRHNIENVYLLRGDFNNKVAVASLEAFLNTNVPFDAVVAADYLMGVAAVDTLRSAGYRIPEDVSVVGFGDGEEAENAQLTTIAANVIEQGRRAARQLIGQINGLRIRGLTVLSTELIVRETCHRREAS
jgi:LacI family transcriptional regulator, galactose operon repressor